MSKKGLTKIKRYIDENYHIEIDSFQNHTLYKRQIAKSGKNVGKERLEILGYFTNTASALKAYLKDTIISEKKALGITEYIELLDTKINTAFEKLENIGDRIDMKIKKGK
jgi:hypothetical protein